MAVDAVVALSKYILTMSSILETSDGKDVVEDLVGKDLHFDGMKWDW